MPDASQNSFSRLIGGHPLAVLGKLALASLIVGAILWTIDVRPIDLYDRIVALVRLVWDMAGDIGRNALTWIALGAVIVVPIWFITRILSAMRR